MEQPELRFDDVRKVLLPFGMHCGKTLEHIAETDITYLDWVLGWEGLYPQMKVVIKRFLQEPHIAKQLEEELEKRIERQARKEKLDG